MMSVAPSSPPAVSHVSEDGPGPETSSERDTGGQRRSVIVPRRPSLLREHETARQRPRDELDDFIDDLFGATIEEKPGRFDALLVSLGLLLITWVAVLDGPTLALWVGIGAIVLGLALPIRAVLRRYGSARTGGLRRRILDGGQLLDASHPATVALIDAYAHLIQMSCLQGTGDPKRAVAAGHMAVAEVATYLDGRPPESPAKVRFVTVRTEGIQALTRQMLRSHDRWAARTAIEQPSQGEARSDSTTTSQFESLDALARSGALAELERLNDQLRRETADEPR
jgi:hypothetical protein